MAGKRLFWAAVALQILVLFGMVGMHSFTLMTGQPVRLKVVPVDPWDLFRGQYVTLRYEMSQLRSDEVIIHADGALRPGQTVYVWLRPEAGGYYEPVQLSETRSEPPKGHVELRGKVEFAWTEGPGQAQVIQVRYGVEQFYVPEGEGRRLEEQIEKLTVEVVVDRFGRGALRQVLLDGAPVDWR